jgi:hypothetical protein
MRRQVENSNNLNLAQDATDPDEATNLETTETGPSADDHPPQGGDPPVKGR